MAADGDHDGSCENDASGSNSNSNGSNSSSRGDLCSNKTAGKEAGDGVDRVEGDGEVSNNREKKRQGMVSILSRGVKKRQGMDSGCGLSFEQPQ